jgi:hypothetical protein
MAAHVAWASAFEGDLASFESSLLSRLFALGRLLVLLMAMARQERLTAAAGSPVCRVVRHVRTVVGVVAVTEMFAHQARKALEGKAHVDGGRSQEDLDAGGR